MRILLRVILKEFFQLRRDRKMIPVTVIGPIIQLLALGYAANNDVREIPTVLVDQDRSAQSRDLVERFVGSGYFTIAASVPSVGEIDPWLISGEAQMALVVGAGFGAAVVHGRAPRVQVIADGSDSSTAVVGLGHAARIVGALGGELATARIDRMRLAAPNAAVALAGHVELVPRVWYNPDLLSRWYYVPAVLAMVLMLVTMIVPSMAVVREKEIGTLEQILVTPIRPWQLILGKLLPFAVIGMLDTLLVTAVARHLFGVPLRGSLALLLGLTALFLLNTLGLGLLVSSLVRTQQQAMLFSMYLIMVPMIYLSGLIFPIENMPAVIQYATYAVPLRYYAIIIRGIFLKGAGIGVLWPQAVVLAASGTAVLLAASLRFRKSLD